jgi:selenocysteine lyase/cysteine desulfurase/CRP-like cAMP-binding protein
MKLQDLLRRTGAFGSLREDEAVEIARRLKPFTLEAGESLFRQGDAPTAAFIIESGTLELVQRALGNRHVVLQRLGPAAVFGEFGMVSGQSRAASAIAVNAVRGYRLDTSEFNGMVLLSHGAAFGLLRTVSKTLCRKLRELNRVEAKRLAADSPGEMSHSRLVVRPDVTDPPGLPSDDTCRLLGVLPFFREFSDTETRELAKTMREWRVPRGRTVFSENAAGDSCYVLVRGAVEISMQVGPRRHRLAVVGPGKIFGEVTLLDEAPRSATCTAREDAVLLEFDATTFNRLMDARSTVAMKFLVGINRSLIEAIRRSSTRMAAGDESHREGPFPVVAETAGLPATPAESLERSQRRHDHGAEALLQRIRESIVGDDVVVDTPFGPRRVLYADYTASGRSLGFIERFIQDEVLPLYANTHTESSGTGLQTSRLRADARRIIHEAVGGGADDIVIFAGTGATGAIDRLINVMNLRIPNGLDARYGFSKQIPADDRPVVFVGPYEHHSNDVQWRETIGDVVMIQEDDDGRIDLADLEAKLEQYRDRKLKIGSFSAASNVTGIISDDIAIATLLHRHGALSFWDYAAAGPYLDVRMNPTGEGIDAALARKDAVFLSPHKFIGGPGTPGVLIAKRALFDNAVPAVPGGGTVSYVSPWKVQYLEDPEHREEGGTPGIVESIRAGLVFQLKSVVGVDAIRAREDRFSRRAIASWSENPRIWLLGNPELDRLSIVSMCIRHGERFLHWNFVVALLNDLFGIQARGGCSCAGPYGHSLFGIDHEQSCLYEAQTVAGYEGLKPGWFRINFNYFISDTAFDYIVSAVHMIANEGWKLLPLYAFDPLSALWTHRTGSQGSLLSLGDLSYVHGQMQYRAYRPTEPESVLPSYLEKARRTFERAPELAAAAEAVQALDVSAEFERLRWFVMPAEVIDDLRALRA